MAIDINNFSDGKEIQNSDGSYEWQGNEIFDRIMMAVNGNIKTEYDNGRITGAEYATVYLGALQSAIAEATKIVVNKELIDAQTSEQLKATNRADQKLADDLLTAAKQRDKIDKDIETANKQQLILDQEKLAKEYEVTHLLPAQVSKLDKEVITERNKGAEIADATVRANTELNDKLLTTAKQRSQIDAQIEELTENGAADRIIKAGQTALIRKQLTTETNKATLIARQTNAYNDKLRIEKAKALGNTVGMAWAGGTEVTNNLDGKLANAIAEIV